MNQLGCCRIFKRDFILTSRNILGPSKGETCSPSCSILSDNLSKDIYFSGNLKDDAAKNRRCKATCNRLLSVSSDKTMSCKQSHHHPPLLFRGGQIKGMKGQGGLLSSA